MAHARKQVRDAVGTLLSAGTPTNWKRVFKTRITPSRDVMPYLMVFIGPEVNAPLEVHQGPDIQREMQLSVRGRVRISGDGEPVEDDMDALAAEVESKLTFAALNTALGGKLQDLYLQASDQNIVEDDDNDRTYAEVALDWLVQVNTAEGDSETLI